MKLAALTGFVVVFALGGGTGAEPPERQREALWLGMDYMIRSASDRGNFDEYASDYLFFFADILRVEDPWIQALAKSHGRRLGNIYLEELFELDSADAVVDAASALWALERLGMDVEPALVLVREAAGRFPLQDYWTFDPARREAPSVDALIDLLIGFHFTDRMGVDVGVTYGESLMFVPSVPYVIDAEVGGDTYVDQNNLVTHLVYTLSGYADWYLDPELVPREMAYVRTQIPAATMWADPETLAEFVDSLKVMGAPEDDPDVRAGVEVLLGIQKPDGRWEPEEAEDEYDRYHSTWCAMDAIRGYELGEARGPGDELAVRLLRRWAGQWMRGEGMRPLMRVSLQPELE